MLGVREFPSFIVIGKKLFANMFAECLIYKNWLSCLREDLMLCCVLLCCVGYSDLAGYQ